MAYNMNYTILPTFTPQSIGYTVASSNNIPISITIPLSSSTGFPPYTGVINYNIINTSNVGVGVYILTCTINNFSFTNNAVPVGNFINYSFSSTSFSTFITTTYCAGSTNYTSGSINVSQVFTLSTVSSVVFNINFNVVSTTTNSTTFSFNTSYSLVRIA